MKTITNNKHNIILNISRYLFILIIGFSILNPFNYINKNFKLEAIEVNSQIKNPLGNNLNTIPEFIEAAINIVLVVGIPLLALAIIYAGFLFVKAQGNSSELEVAKRTLLYTVIGGVLLLGAFVIASAIGSTVDDIKKSS